MSPEISSSSGLHQQPIFNDAQTYHAGSLQYNGGNRESTNVPYFNVPEVQSTSSSLWPNGGRVQPAPLLEAAKYSAWKREFTFWRELYGFLPDSYLLSVIGSGPSPLLKNMVMKLFRDTKDTK